MEHDPAHLSRRLSYLLHHAPQEAGLTLETGGWVPVAELLAGLAAGGLHLSRAQLEAVVAGNDEGRFAFDASGERIRANQGHSVPVDLELEPQPPPAALYHGTARRFLAAIMQQGLLRMQRHHVHLSPDTDTATRVGARRGPPVLLQVDAAAMQRARSGVLMGVRSRRHGHTFYRSENGVWLTDRVPPEFLTVLPDEGGR